MDPMFNDDFFSGFGFDPFSQMGMGRGRGNGDRPAQQRDGGLGHPFFNQGAQQDQQEHHQADEEERRRRMLQQRRQQQQRVDPLAQMFGLQDGEAQGHPLAQMFGASPQQQQRRSPPPRIAVPPSLAQNPQFQRLSQQEQQEYLRQLLAKQREAEAEQQQQQQRRSPPPRIAVPPSIAQNPQFQRLSLPEQQEFMRQLLARQQQQELQEQEQERERELAAQRQAAQEAEAQRARAEAQREQVLADALLQQQLEQPQRSPAKQTRRQEQPHRMVCDETQTSDDEEAEPTHHTVNEATETEGGDLTRDTATGPAAGAEPSSPAFLDCNDTAMQDAEPEDTQAGEGEKAAEANQEFAECAETEQEAVAMQKELEEASHASTVSSDEDMDLQEAEAEAEAEPQAEGAAPEVDEEDEVVSPLKSLKAIEEIKKEAEDVATRWAPEAFVVRNPKTNDAVKKARAFYSEGLLQCVIKLDGVDSLGDANIRKARKNAVNEMEKKVDELKEWGKKHDILA